MTELRAADLRFTPEEAATFLNRVMGLELSAEDTAELEGRTEGWIAGLQMAALAMRDRADVSGFIAAFTGSNRYVLDYLAEEVLARQPEELQTFLLETSILDRMCAPLCNAVTGRADGQTALERLEHANLFVIPLDDERHWYRYHHLFADVLRQRLRQEHPDLVPVLHKQGQRVVRASRGWLPKRFNHALAAQDWERAVRLIESNGVTVVLGRQVQTMLAWIDRIPEELARERPALCTIRALALVLSNRPDAAEASLRDAERYLGADPTTDQARTILGRAAVTRAAIARSSGDLERCVAMGRRALELLPETESNGRAAAKTNAALAYQVSGDVAPANERALEEVTASFHASGAQVMLLRSIDFLARLRTLQGRLRAAAATYEESAQVASGRDGLRGTVNSAAYYVGLGDIHREWNDLDSAESHLRRGIEMFTGTMSVDAEVVTHGYLSLARLQQARGRHADAQATLEEFADLARQRDFFSLLAARGEAALARLALVQDDLPAAVSWAEASGLGAYDELSYRREEQYLTRARVLIAQGRLDPMGSYLDDALGLLDRLFKIARVGGGWGASSRSWPCARWHCRRDTKRVRRLRHSKEPSYSRNPKATSASSWTKERRWRPCSRSSSRGARDPVTHRNTLCSAMRGGCWRRSSRHTRAPIQRHPAVRRRARSAATRSPHRTRAGGTRADRRGPLKPGDSSPALHRGRHRQRVRP